MTSPPEGREPEGAGHARRIAAAGALWAASILLSRVIGLVREWVLGRTLGATAEGDVYRTAFVVPDAFLHIMAGGALSVVMIPLFSAHLERGDEARASRTFSVIANFLVLLLGVLLPLTWWGMPWLTRLLAPGFGPEDAARLVTLSRIVLPGTVFHLLGGLLQAALLAKDKHALPALAPLVYTGGVIAGGLLGRSAEGFAWGVVAGAALGPFLLPLVAALRGGLRWRLQLDLGDPDFRTWIVRSLPVMLGWSIVGMDDAVIAWFGSAMAEGTTAVLGYAKQLMKVPMGVFGAAMGYAAFPTLARLWAGGKRAEVWDTVAVSVRRVLVLAAASQVVLTAAGTEVGTLLYSTRRIPPEAMERLGTQVALFCLALPAWSVQVVVARGFYAMGRVWLPTWLGFAVLVASLPVYAALGAAGGGPGLALASSVGISIYTVLLVVLLARALGAPAGLLGATLRLGGATAAGIGVALGTRQLLPAPTWTFADAAWRAALLGGLGGLAFLAAAALLRVPDLAVVTGPVERRLRPLLRRLR